MDVFFCQVHYKNDENKQFQRGNSRATPTLQRGLLRDHQTTRPALLNNFHLIVKENSFIAIQKNQTSAIISVAIASFNLENNKIINKINYYYLVKVHYIIIVYRNFILCLALGQLVQSPAAQRAQAYQRTRLVALHIRCPWFRQKSAKIGVLHPQVPGPPGMKILNAHKQSY